MKGSGLHAHTVYFPKEDRGFWLVLCVIDLLDKTNAKLLISCSNIILNKGGKKKEEEKKITVSALTLGATSHESMWDLAVFSLCEFRVRSVSIT